MPLIPNLKFRWRHLGNPYAFLVTAPYSEGHLLTKAEAQALNVVRMENIQNNLRQAFANEAASSTDNVLSLEALDRIQLIVTKYDESYQFVEIHETKEKPDALEREAKAIAIGRMEEGTSEAEIEALAATIDVLAEARERLEAKAKIAKSSLEDLLS